MSQRDQSMDSKSDSGSSSMADRLAKFKQLKQKKQEGKQNNKNELYKEYKQQRQKTLKLKSLESRKEQAEQELEKIEAGENGEDFQRKKAWDWTIEETEKWNEKQKSLKDSHNFSQIAELSYKKELENMTADKDSYQLQKDKLVKKYNVSESDVLGIVDFENKPSKEAIDRLVNGLDKANQRRMTRRNTKEDDVGSYINDRNKDFNKKIEREFKKYRDE